jgi:hypothetical protein
MLVSHFAIPYISTLCERVFQGRPPLPLTTPPVSEAPLDLAFQNPPPIASGNWRLNLRLALDERHQKKLAKATASPQTIPMDDNHPPTPETSTPESDLHWRLWEICKKLPDDYEPYGKGSREEADRWFGDCSCGCKFYLPLEGRLGADWGVCGNPSSHRCGLLTFEHQGCRHFEMDESDLDS